ncbi:TIGR03667 family PPOX class F420-dependent oxidoreductase [Nocardia cyriacigeorgica]|uniref:TIGR03667 family PPOX class F420-dependent oxidoreductase n=1 Tax=Nocardia cyriacigeorgica TaxID=135487 RepID=A0A5R8NZX5_9NOCA|nr:TIGR03667 family PPOX class F420-dependent oxidoreductase [Nocardia cyriacigeorgica]TLF82479.1 TIGR03667 family PPOX class F420-dependent oxidoreductase [Nocardia cyriacigeorgica]
MATAGSAQLIDPTTEFGAKVAQRLDSEQVVWLTTVGPSGTPQPNPVWFLWRDGEFLLFSQPDRPKLRNIARNPRVSLNLNSTDTGGDVAVFTGTARVEEATPTPEEIEAYVAKYTEGLVSISMTREQFFAEYSVPVRITPDRLRGF